MYNMHVVIVLGDVIYSNQLNHKQELYFPYRTYMSFWQ